MKNRAAAQREAARLRLFGSADEAVATLQALLLEGTADAVRLKAATEVLDRVGIKTATEIQVEVTDARSPAERVREALDRLAHRELSPAEAEQGDVVDAEEVAPDD